LRAIAQSGADESNPQRHSCSDSRTSISRASPTKDSSFERDEVDTSYITRSFDNSCSSRNELHGGTPPSHKSHKSHRT
jgi:hypothetical protein